MNNRSLNNDSDEDGTNENAFLTSILSILNGYCKINLEVQQVNLFYSNDSLLPINAKVNSNTYNNIHKVQSVQKLRSNTNILKNEENIESACQSNSLNKPSNAEFQMYSKPFNYHSILNTDKNTNVVPKGTKKNNNNIFIRPSTLDNQLDNLSLRTDQNVSNDINISQCDDENVEFGLQSQQDKQLQNKQINNSAYNINFPQLKQKNDIKIKNENSSKQSECPLCFELYPSKDIEAHASECNI